MALFGFLGSKKKNPVLSADEKAEVNFVENLKAWGATNRPPSNRKLDNLMYRARRHAGMYDAYMDAYESTNNENFRTQAKLQTDSLVSTANDMNSMFHPWQMQRISKLIREKKEDALKTDALYNKLGTCTYFNR